MIANKHLTQVFRDFAERIYSEESDSFRSERLRYRADWVLFAQEVLGVSLYGYQIEIINQIQRDKRLAVKALRGVGKTTIAAIVVLAVVTLYGDPYDSTDDVKVVTTAGRYRQLEEYLWPEIRKWALRADWSRIGIKMRIDKELLRMAIRLGNRLAFAASPDKPEGIEGAHAKTLLMIVDEAKITPPEVWDAMEGAFSTANPEVGDRVFAFAISTPGEPSGRFYDIVKGKKGYEDWGVYNVTLEDALAAGRIDPAWVEQRKIQWGEDDPRYKNQVLGEFADFGESSLYKLSWLERAIELWYDRQDEKHEGLVAYGVDPADGGVDNSAICRWIGSYCEWIKYYDVPVMELVPIVQRLLGPATNAPIGFDTIGVGTGAYQTLKKKGYKVVSLKASAAAVDRAGEPIMDAYRMNTFRDLRSAMYWRLREGLDPTSPHYANIALPPDDRLTSELLAHEWAESNGVLRVLPKDDVKKKIGHSPDGSDCLTSGFFVRQGMVRTVGIRRI